MKEEEKRVRLRLRVRVGVRVRVRLRLRITRTLMTQSVTPPERVWCVTRVGHGVDRS